MKDAISVLTFVRTVLIFQNYILHAESYNISCPSQANWKFRAKVKCNSTSKYFCLYNNVDGKYVEGCKGPDWDRSGSKRIYVGDFSRGICKKERFQPFKFYTNESMSDCIYAKSICNEEGQIAYIGDSTKEDRTCRCDFRRNYSFIITPKNICYCIPTTEDCSCHIRLCPVNFTLSADYECTQNGNQEQLKCTEITKYSETIDEKTGVHKEKVLWLMETSPMLKWNEKITAPKLFCLCFIMVAGGFFFAVLFHKWSSEKIQLLKRHFHRNKPAELKTGERNFLRIIHLMYRVACPVVRMTFNHEIQPNQLRQTLKSNKNKMEKQYRRKEKIISDYQWDLLYNYEKGKEVTSKDFDIKLMIRLLRTIANIKVGQLYPVPSDTSVSAMLSKIEYIRNDATQSVDNKLPEEQFNHYWDDIGQAVRILVSSHTVDIDDETEKKTLIGRLGMLNPFNVDNEKLRKFIDLSEIYPAEIIKQIIDEYCTTNERKIEDILTEEKHDLYHKRIITESCCECDVTCPTFTKMISEKQWEALYEVAKCSNSHSCPLSFKKCIKNFIPKNINTSDLSVSMPLVLYIPDMLKHIISRSSFKRFDKFIKNNKHTIYTFMEKRMPCICYKVPTEKSIITKNDWNKLFEKTNNVSCKTCTQDCCCQYSAISGIQSSRMDETLLCKILHVAGPISVLNRIGHNAFLNFLKWTADDRPLRDALTELLKVVKDEKFRSDLSKRISTCSSCDLDETITKQVDAREWVSKHVKYEMLTTEPPLQILVFDRDGVNVKSVQIPKDFPLPDRIRHFKDLSNEENNFLVVVHGLTTIVYPVIKDAFNRICPEEELAKIRGEIYEQHKTNRNKNSSKDEIRKKKIYLTQKQQEQLFSPKKEESRNLDWKLMIYLLKRKTEEDKKQDYDQLDVIDNIRREIVESSSGVLNETRFQDIIKLIRKAVVHFGGDLYEKKITNLQHIRNILDVR